MDEITWRLENGDVVEVYLSPDRDFRYRVRAANGEVVEQGSEGYQRKGAAITAAERHHPRTEVES